MSESWIEADWPAPPGIRAATTLRCGGASLGPYTGFNLGSHVDDNPEHVATNRRLLKEGLGLPAEPYWLAQVHGIAAVPARREPANPPPEADAAHTAEPGVVCAVLTADCLPVLFCDRAGTRVGAAHAGWRGLAAGVLESTLAAMGEGDWMAWLGPAIGPQAFEVGPPVREAFRHKLSDECLSAFLPISANHWLADLYALARLSLRRAGVDAVYGGGYCTYSEAGRFFSYRRDRQTGRMASLVWREPSS